MTDSRRPHDRAIRSRSNPPPHDSRYAEPMMGASFRVYTPAELQHVALRPSYRPSPERGIGQELKETFVSARALGPRKILTWAGIALVATTLLFAGLLALANVTDDTLATGKNPMTAMNAKARSANASANAKDADDGASNSALAAPASTGTGTDFELPDDSVPVQRTAAKTRVTPKQGKRSVGSSVTIRSAPF